MLDGFNGTESSERFAIDRITFLTLRGHLLELFLLVFKHIAQEITLGLQR